MPKYTPASAGKVTLEEIDRRQSLTPLTFGTPKLDGSLVPMTAGDLVSVVARPGMGKTLFLVHLTNHLQKQGANVAYITYETSVTEFTCLRLGIKLEDVGRGKIPRQSIKDKIAKSIFDRVTVFGQADGELAPTLDEVIKWLGKDRYDVVLVDYLQRIRGSYHQDRHHQVSENAERLKDLALKMGMPVVMAVQARRDVDDYSGLKFPGLNDAQWSCLSADTVIWGSNTRIDSGSVNTLSMNSEYKCVDSGSRNTMYVGEEQVFEVKAAGGYKIRATLNHPFLTTQGWTKLEDLKPGDYVAVASHLPEMRGEYDKELSLLAGLMEVKHDEVFVPEDIRFVKIKSISDAGIEPVYDVSVPEYRNYIANGFVVHNSNIEQTSDKVLSLTRPRYYMTEDFVTVDHVDYQVKTETLAVQVVKQRWSLAGHVLLLESDFSDMSIKDAEPCNNAVF